MNISGKLPDFNDLSNLGIKNISSIHWNLTKKELTEITINNGMGNFSFIWSTLCKYW